MVTLNANLDGAERVANTLDRTFGAALARNRRIFLREAADRVIAEVRDGDWFTNETGKLKAALQRSKPRLTKDTGEIDVMWGGASAAYGPVLEHGPKVPRWIIAPRGTTAKGTAVKALRWPIGAGSSLGRGTGVRGEGGAVGVRFARYVVHVDRPTSRRKHIGPTVKKLGPWFHAKQVDMIARAKAAAGFKP